MLFLFAVPVHFWTHLGLLFFTSVWTSNIHDTITVNSEPIMGAGYHTLHHTTYRDNYGQFFGACWRMCEAWLQPPLS